MIKEVLIIASILQMTYINVRDWGMAGQYNNTSLRNTSILLKRKKDMLKIKPGVNLTGLANEMVIAAIVAEGLLAELSKDCVITSALDSKHSATSFHYRGGALDFRTRHLNNTQQKIFEEGLKAALNNDYEVILEHNHMHVEYQPKRL